MEKKHTAKAASALAAPAGVDGGPPQAAATASSGERPADITALNFEQAMAELEQVTRRLEQGDLLDCRGLIGLPARGVPDAACPVDSESCSD